MSRAYYYLIASLPLLDFNNPAPISYDSFLQQCFQQLHKNDLTSLQRATLAIAEADAKDNRLLKSWAHVNQQMRWEIARHRYLKMGRDPAASLKESASADQALILTVKEAFQADDPLTAEKILDRFRWNFLEELTQGKFFTFELILIYALKLQILERYQNIAAGIKGKEVFETYKKAIFEKVTI